MPGVDHFLTKEKFLSAKWFRAVLLILTGTFIMSVGFVFFISPYRFAPGGVYGIAIVLHHLFNLPTGMIALIIDIPLTLIGIKIQHNYFIPYEIDENH